MVEVSRMEERARDELKLFSNTDKWLFCVFSVKHETRPPRGNDFNANVWFANQESPDVQLIWPLEGESLSEYPFLLIVARITASLSDTVVIDLQEHQVSNQFHIEWNVHPGAQDTQFRSILGVPVFNSRWLRPNGIPQASLGVVSFASTLSAQDLVKGDKLRRVASKHAELLFDSVNKQETHSSKHGRQFGTMYHFPDLYKTLLYGAGAKPKQIMRDWTEFVSGAFAPTHAIDEFNRTLLSRRDSANYYNENF